MRIYETDSHAEDGFIGRRNDVMGMVVIDRAASERPEGVWITFHTFTNDHPRRAREEVAIRALVRTRTATTEQEPIAAILARACTVDGPPSLCAPWEGGTPTAPHENVVVEAPSLFPATLAPTFASLARALGAEPKADAQNEGHSCTGAPERECSR
ncbi:MAG: hypothetical protein H5U40_14840 [Polyangiaceae bacterium]|nr:hypothetical protein [Polyangiaceae bacterium]